MSARDIYPNELLSLARELVTPIGRGRPQTIRLRRGVSTAYYALFHRISRDVAHELLGSYATPAAHAFVRFVDHNDLNLLAQEVLGQGTKLAPFLDAPSPRLISLCEAFVELRTARHDADYKHEFDLTSARARALVRLATRAVNDAVRMRKDRDNSYRQFLKLGAGSIKRARRRS